MNRLADVETLRIRRSLAPRVLAVLKDRRVPLGPVLDNRARAAVEIVVPPGTAATWPALPGTRCVTGACLTGPARAWISPPAPDRGATDPDALCEAVTVALAHLAAPLLGAVHPRPEGAPMTDHSPINWPLFAPQTWPAALRPVPRRFVPDATGPQPRYQTVTLPGTSSDTPGRARAYVVDFLREWQVPERIVQDLRLIVSELATNSLIHVGHGDMTVRVSVSDTEATVSVTDQGSAGRPTVCTTTATDEHGRGLAIAQTLADRLEVLSRSGSTEVLAAITLPGHRHGLPQDGQR